MRADRGAVAGPPRAAVAFDDLETAVRHLGDELAFFRRRALDAERRLREVSAARSASGAGAGVDVSALERRIATLEAENADLRARLAEAAERTRAVADRMRFVRQQQEADDEH